MVDNNLLIKDFTPEQAREAEEKQRMTQEAALKGLTDPRVKQYKRGRGGGARSLSTAERQRLAQQALEKLAQEEEAKSIQRSIAKQKAEERAVELEQARIEKLTQRLAKEGSTRTETFVNRATGDKIQHTITTRTGGERVFTRTNLKTGEITTKTFEERKGGGGVQQSGGIISVPAEGFSPKLDTEGLADNRAGFQQAITQGLQETKGKPAITFSERETARILSGGGETSKNVVTVFPTTEPFLFEKQTGTFKDAKVTELTYVDPGTKAERKATKEEGVFFSSINLPTTSSTFPTLTGADKFLFEQSLREQRFGQAEQTGRKIGFKESVLFAGGFALAPVVSTAVFVKQLVTQPITTIKSIPGGLKQTAISFGKEAKVSPFLASAKVGREVLFFKGVSALPRGVVKVSDLYRTRGLKELPATSLIAPEYFRGQTFPAIRKGQTAGELKAEFKPLLPGETKPAGFTASPGSFKTETIAGKGTSSLPGLFQAPKISPQFLKVSAGERKLVSFNILDTLKPTIIRTTPTKFRLGPGVKETTRAIQPESPARIFLQQKARDQAKKTAAQAAGWSYVIFKYDEEITSQLLMMRIAKAADELEEVTDRNEISQQVKAKYKANNKSEYHRQQLAKVKEHRKEQYRKWKERQNEHKRRS